MTIWKCFWRLGPHPDAAKIWLGSGTGAAASEWSEWLGFRSLYHGDDGDAGPTRFAIYGDMGAFPAFDAPGSATPPFPVPAPARHNVGNLVDDLAAGRAQTFAAWGMLGAVKEGDDEEGAAAAAAEAPAGAAAASGGVRRRPGFSFNDER